MTKEAKWIWVDENSEQDTYGEFYTEFSYDGGDVKIKISADSNYTLFLNGTFVESGQYPDFPHYKVYDEIDITSYCKKGKNSLAIVVRYYGKENMSYYVGKAGLYFKVIKNGELILASNEDILSRYSRTYKNGLCKMITSQLGFSWLYDATKEDGWKTGNLDGFSKSSVVNQDLKLFPRPISKLSLLKPSESTCILRKENYALYDLGFEEVGYFTFKVSSKKKQKLTICYGEHIIDGGVRRKIGGRDFSFEIIVGEGTTEYTNYFLRLGLRYLEIFSEDDVEIEYMTVIPTMYPLKKNKKAFKNELHQKIYDVSVRTLELCMHDHYEDCPWREQGLYAMDSRNQIICGYHAFSEYDFPRSNLYLMSKDKRDDKLISICIPTSMKLLIPSFCLHYFTEIYEYTLYSKDLTLAKEVLPRLKEIIAVFLERKRDGLIYNFAQTGYWDFYEWTYDLNGEGEKKTLSRPDACLNCLVSIALLNMQKICDLIGEKADYLKIRDELNENIYKAFYDEEKKLFVNDLVDRNVSELANSLAVLCGAAKGDSAKKICEILASENELHKISLSMACFKFDALLATDKEKYSDYVIGVIEEKYSKMLACGATSFWETEEGAEDFGGAGSLCHGWSAMPVYYFDMLLDD